MKKNQVTLKKMGHIYQVVVEGKAIGSAYRNGLRNVAGRGWTYTVYVTRYESKTATLKNAIENIVRITEAH